MRTTFIGGAGVAACAVLLVGCGATEEIPTVPEFQFKSGTLAIEEFSSESVAGNVFDPCTEISAEEYEAAGLNGVRPMESEYEFEDINSCDTNLNEAGQRLTIKAGPISEAGLKTQSENALEYPESIVPGLFTYTNALPGVCFAQVDTERGALTAQMSAQGSGTEDIDRCKIARETIEDIYKAVNTDDEEQ
ncbi:DUF3558 family protein [uncultured Corynebacterium sp.]|uniref:DUF3558 family protein n=1 Tax=uncultured Corynebacterium sp. TaxID=159447 RepID=UPI00260F6D0C|nr:DUF3558 family protein [uncultured Corynebacterium sp.]